ncbi:hypothetical protein BC831DRAFT_482414 [Entophlyctis helioformis]|nr:hypothetical protein BC831DRAFT_482414 [Entophlyctis helioformis]
MTTDGTEGAGAGRVQQEHNEQQQHNQEHNQQLEEHPQHNQQEPARGREHELVVPARGTAMAATAATAQRRPHAPSHDPIMHGDLADAPSNATAADAACNVTSRQILNRKQAVMRPDDTPYKRHILPDGIRCRLFTLLKLEHPDWPHPKSATERRMNTINREMALAEQPPQWSPSCSLSLLLPPSPRAPLPPTRVRRPAPLSRHAPGPPHFSSRPASARPSLLSLMTGQSDGSDADDDDDPLKHAAAKDSTEETATPSAVSAAPQSTAPTATRAIPGMACPLPQSASASHYTTQHQLLHEPSASVSIARDQPLAIDLTSPASDQLPSDVPKPMSHSVTRMPPDIEVISSPEPSHAQQPRHVKKRPSDASNADQHDLNAGSTADEESDASATQREASSSKSGRASKKSRRVHRDKPAVDGLTSSDDQDDQDKPVCRHWPCLTGRHAVTDAMARHRFLFTVRLTTDARHSATGHTQTRSSRRTTRQQDAPHNPSSSDASTAPGGTSRRSAAGLISPSPDDTSKAASRRLVPLLSPVPIHLHPDDALSPSRRRSARLASLFKPHN